MSRNLAILDESLTQFQAKIQAQEQTPYDKIVVGAAVLKHTQTPTNPSILLIKRAANEIYYPDHLELPSGKVSPSDNTILDALARELFEETGLSIESKEDVIAQPNSFEYVTEKTVKEPDGRKKTIRKTAVQINFVVKPCSCGGIKLNLKEHSEYMWATSGKVDGPVMTDLMKAQVQEILGWSTGEGTNRLLQDA